MGPTPCPRAARDGAAPPHGVEGSWLPSFSPLDSVYLSENRRLGFRLSNSENISLITFLNRKTAENRELVLWHLVNRLVQ